MTIISWPRHPRRTCRVLAVYALDLFDALVLRHRFYQVCCWIVSLPWWDDTTDAHQEAYKRLLKRLRHDLGEW